MKDASTTKGKVRCFREIDNWKLRERMKLLQRLFFGLVVFIVLLIGVGFLLPKEWSVERKITIKAPPEQIHLYVSHLAKWQEWTDWTPEQDPTLQYTYEGPEEGVGATQRWTSERMGKGMLRIIRSDPSKGIGYELYFEEEALPTLGEITYQPNDEGTVVVWKDHGNLGNNPINRYFGIIIEYMLGKQFESGLAKLKQKVEPAVQ